MANSEPHWRVWWNQRRETKRLSQGFDMTWMRRLLSVFALSMVTVVMPFNAALQWTAAIATCGFGLLLCVYFGAILFTRLQCRLLEWCVLTAFVGNAEGLLLTSNGLANMGWPMAGLALLVGAWGLYGAVMALAQASLLEVTRPLPRVLLMAVNWLGLASPALIICGLILLSGGLNDELAQLSKMAISRKMQAWGAPLLLLGGAGFLVYGVLEIKVSRAARGIMEGTEKID